MASASPSPDGVLAERLDVVIVNWNSGARLRACLEAIAASSEDIVSLAKVIVVDNASRDGSAAVGDLAARLPLIVLSNTENRGFGAACNQGVAAGRAPFVLFLNPDTRIEPGALAQSLAYLHADDRVHIGALGIRLTDTKGLTQRCCARFPSPWRILGQSLRLDRLVPSLVAPHFMIEWDHSTTRDVDQVMGAFLMTRRALLEKLHGFDERFFVYFEDVDLCLRIRKSGSAVMHCAAPSAVHEGQGTTRTIKDVRLFYFLRSRLLYAGKHFSGLGLAITLLATLVVEPISRLAAAAVRGLPDEIRATIGGYRLLFAALPSLKLRERDPATS